MSDYGSVPSLYDIYMCTGSQCQTADTSAPIKTIAAAANTCQNCPSFVFETTLTNMLARGTAYLFQIKSYNAAGGSPLSDPSALIKTNDLPNPPLALKVLLANQNSVVLTWKLSNDINGADVVSFTIAYYTNPTQASSPTIVAKGNILQTNCPSSTGVSVCANVTGLAIGTTYYFVAATVNSVGTGKYSTSVNCSTNGGIECVQSCVNTNNVL